MLNSVHSDDRVETKPVLATQLAISLAGTTLSADEVSLIKREEIVAIVLFQRNLCSAPQLSLLVKSVRALRNDMLFFIDNEGLNLGGCLREGVWRALDDQQQPLPDFSPPPSQYQLASLYAQEKASGCRQSYLSGQVIAQQLQYNRIISLATVLCSNPDDSPPYAREPMKSSCQSVDQAIPGQAEPDRQRVKRTTTCSQRRYGSWVIQGLGRSFGSQKEAVAILAKSRRDGMKSVHAEYPFVAKHWPDHGVALADTHDYNRVVDGRKQAEILAYCHRLYADVAADIVMTNHVCYADSPTPTTEAGLSRYWLQTLRDLQPDVVIMTDCLAMQAIAASGRTLLEAVLISSQPLSNTAACSDIVTVCNQSVATISGLLNSVCYRPRADAIARLARLRTWSSQ